MSQTAIEAPTPLSAEIQEQLAAYYARHYRDSVGLPDWRQRIENRLREEQTFGEQTLRKIEKWLGYQFAGKRVLVIGTGTGAECMALARRGADVAGIEPNAQALAITRLKAQQEGVNAEAFVPAVAEALPFPAAAFDFVYCHTVLEHVRDVNQSLDEMIRVVKPDGRVYIQTPDYRFPYEGHYKLPLIPFAPRWVQALYLRARGRPARFLASINFLTTPQLDRLLLEKEVDVLRVLEPHLLYWRNSGERFFAWFTAIFAIPHQQTLFLIKRPGGWGAKPGAVQE